MGPLMPLPSTRVIPDGWSRHHAPTAAGGMNATVQVHDPGTAVTAWDDTTEQQQHHPGPAVYDGPARVQELRASTSAEQAGQHVAARRYLVQLDYDAAPIMEGWTVTVTGAVNDPDLVTWTRAHPMHVTDVQHGSERFTRDLVTELNLD